MVLSLHMNEAGESCFPSLNTIARRSGLSRSSVKKHLKIASKKGWICKNFEKLGNGYKNNTYCSVIPDKIKRVGREATYQEEENPQENGETDSETTDIIDEIIEVGREATHYDEVGREATQGGPRGDPRVGREATPNIPLITIKEPEKNAPDSATPSERFSDDEKNEENDEGNDEGNGGKSPLRGRDIDEIVEWNRTVKLKNESGSGDDSEPNEDNYSNIGEYWKAKQKYNFDKKKRRAEAGSC